MIRKLLISCSKYLIISLVFIGYYQQLYSLPTLYDWKVYTTMNQNISLSIDSKGRIWTGGVGGVYYYDPSNGDYREFRNTDGLLSTEISVVKCDTANKKIYIGCYDGIVEIMSEDFTIKHNTEIKSQNFTNPEITDIKFYNSKVYIAGNFGIAVYDPANDIFLETILKLNTFQQNTPVKSLLIANNYIYAATSLGLAVANVNSVINDPASWKVYTSSNGLAEPELLYIDRNLIGEIFVASQTYLYQFKNDTFNLISHLTGSGEIFTGMQKAEDQFFYITSYGLHKIDTNTYYTLPVTDEVRGVIYRPGQSDYHQIILAYKSEGICIVNKTFDSLNVIQLNTPSANLFTDMTIDTKGNLWVVNGSSNGKGIMTFNGKTWTNFNVLKYPAIVSNSYHKINSLSDGRIIASNWGDGFALISKNDTSYNFKIFNTTNTPLNSTLTSSTTYCIPAGVAQSPDGKLWIVDHGESTSGPMFISFDPNTFVADSFYNCVSEKSRNYMDIVIDWNGTKWITSGAGGGLFYYNDMGTADKSDDICGVMTNSNYPNLSADDQTCLAVDKNGWLWIGTGNGLSVLYNPSFILSNSSAIMREETNLKQVINDILVDALNNKWIATETGVWQIDDEANVTSPITTDNSSLISNSIISLAYNENTGEIYMGSLKGLCVAKSYSIKPLDDYNISVYPQPFIPQKDDKLIIDGLAENSDVRILTLDGELIKSFQTTSREVAWDGKDYFGNYVSTGTYIITSSSGTTSKGGVGKIAVIKK